MKIFSPIEIDGFFKIGKYEYKDDIMFTPWSYAHFVSGFILQQLGFNYTIGFIIHSIYEYLNYTSNYLQKKWSGIYIGYRYDSLLNIFGDTIAFMLGMLISKKNKNKMLIYFVLITNLFFHTAFVQNILMNNRYDYLNEKIKKSQLDTLYEKKKEKNEQYNEQYKYNSRFIVLLCLTVYILYKT